MLAVFSFCGITNCKTNYGHNILNTNNKIFFWISFIIILLLGVFRGEFLGVDQDNYFLAYKNYSEKGVYDIISQWNKIDIGYYLLGNLLSRIGCSFYMFKTILYVFIMIVYGHVVYTRSNNPSFSFLIIISLGFLGFNFCILRQSVAVAICVFAYKYVTEKKPIKFFICILIASTFHQTAVFFLLIYLLVNFKILIKSEFLRKIVYVFIFLLISALLVPNLTLFYQKNDYSSRIVQGEGIPMLLVLIVITSTFSLFSSSKMFSEKVYLAKEEMLNDDRTIWASVYAQICAVSFSLFARIVNYFTFILPFTIPKLLKSNRNKYLFFFIYLFIFAVLFVLNLLDDSTKILQYFTIFS